jgi:hypothetical protein
MLIVGIGISGCASAGREFDQAQVDHFQTGHTTEAEVISTMGQPNAYSSGLAGQHVLIYTYAHTQVRAATFVPVVGMFAGGADTASQSASFTFSANGVLQNVSRSGLNISSSNGL